MTDITRFLDDHYRATEQPTWGQLDAANIAANHYGRGKPDWLLEAEVQERRAAEGLAQADENNPDAFNLAYDLWYSAEQWRLDCAAAYHEGRTPYSLRPAVQAEISEEVPF